eukprot:m.20197 g.20197  ORF g.20197 m.20197 type:complete len:185 (+) comp8551_c0_seq1:40-594(+)
MDVVVGDVVEKMKGLEQLLSLLDGVDMVEMKSKMTPMDAAKFDSLMAYSFNTLFWVYLSSKGIDPKTHDVKKELDRVKDVMHTLHLLEHGTARNPKQPSVNKEVAARMITASIEKPANHHTSKSSTSAPKDKGGRKVKDGKSKDNNQKKQKKQKKKKEKKNDKSGKRNPDKSTENKKKRRKGKK